MGDSLSYLDNLLTNIESSLTQARAILLPRQIKGPFRQHTIHPIHFINFQLNYRKGHARN